jgi:hypothetical protein
MKKRFYLGLIILAVLLLALGGLTVRATRATVRVLVQRGKPRAAPVRREREPRFVSRGPAQRAALRPRGSM